MNKHLLLLFFLVGSASALFGQTIFDFETPETSATYTYFGSSLDGSSASIIDNPNATGINTTPKVLEFLKPAGAEVWAGAYASENAPIVDCTNGGQICVDVHMDHIGNLGLKLEAATNGASNWIQTVSNTVINEWETICFDLSLNGLEDAMTPAAGNVYQQLVLFADFGMMGTDNDVTYYFDNINFVPVVTKTNIFDFETPETSATYTYFGSSLDGSTTSIIDNPNPTGGNTSPKVLEFLKPAGAEVWAGAYASENAPIVDCTNGGQICVDVHMDHIGNLAVKLENATNGASNWIQTVANTKVGEWERLCYDLSLNGLEDAMTPAAGNVYQQLVLFADFGTMGTDVDVTYYFDNICLESSGQAEDFTVKFSVDMNGYSESFGTVYLSGQFNDWSGGANPMSDDDLDGIWETTLTLPSGLYEYKFQLDEWATSEQMDPSDACTKSTDDGNGNIFTNRLLTLTGDTDLPAVCYESCYVCGGSVEITWNVNMQNETVSDLGVYVAGGLYFGHGDLPAMRDDDGDGIYSITLEREVGFTTDYTFINGLCLPDWSCKENLSGQACAIAPFNDRRLLPVTQDTVLSTCFGECSIDGTCSGGPLKYLATFSVDMSNTTVDGNVYLSGGLINNWSPDATPLTDDNSDGIYEVTVELSPGVIEYKYVNGTNYENLAEGDCTITDPSGQFINRLLLMEEKDTVLATYLYESCEIFVGVQELEINDNLFRLSPNPSSDYTNIICDQDGEKLINIFDINGSLVKSTWMSKDSKSIEISTQEFNTGLYIITVTTDQYLSSQKLIVE